ncbi:MAG: transaldolase family protein [Phycisphaeraceae bacterium]
MPSALQSLIQAGTKLWLDSVDPDEVARNLQWGATGATSNPIIVADLIKSGRFDEQLQGMMDKGLDDEGIAWALTDYLVRKTQKEFGPTWEKTGGNDGYVSFELDPLLEDPALGLSDKDRAIRYIDLGKSWAKGHDNRLIKVPATPGGIMALEELAAANIPLNVTLMFTLRQYRAARDSIWRGAQRRASLDTFKSVYSIFISRVDVYTDKHEPNLSAAQGWVGIVNAKRIWQENDQFWKSRNPPLQQEIVFASTGVKMEGDPPDKYVSTLVGDGIQTNPPATNEAVEKLGKTYHRTVDQLPPKAVLEEIDQEVDMRKLEKTLLEEGIRKFADPQKELLKLIGDKRQQLAAAP